MTNKHYKLTKISKTGYEFSTSDIEMVYDRLDEFVCTSCKVKHSEAKKYCEENPTEEFKQEEFIEEAFPEVQWFLWAATASPKQKPPLCKKAA